MFASEQLKGKETDCLYDAMRNALDNVNEWFHWCGFWKLEKHTLLDLEIGTSLYAGPWGTIFTYNLQGEGRGTSPASGRWAQGL